MAVSQLQQSNLKHPEPTRSRNPKPVGVGSTQKRCDVAVTVGVDTDRTSPPCQTRPGPHQRKQNAKTKATRNDHHRPHLAGAHRRTKNQKLTELHFRRLPGFWYLYDFTVLTQVELRMLTGQRSVGTRWWWWWVREKRSASQPQAK